MLPPAFEAELVDVIGSRHVVTDPEITAGWSVDWTGRFRGDTPAVVRPGSTAEVAGVIDACRRAGIALVPQGGNTGLVGGSVPLADEVVLSLRRLDAITDGDPISGQLTAGAGATISAVARVASAMGWAYGVDWAARDSATVGGSVATNAGGLRVLRHGDTRRQLMGVEAVLGDGSTVTHLGGLVKDNTGYDLAGLLCGSEGTLGVVTAARLALVTPLPQRVVALLAFDGTDPLLAAVGLLRRELPSLAAAEVFFGDGLALVCEQLHLPAPLAARHEAYLLVEAASTTDPSTELALAVESLAGVRDVAVAVDRARGDALWRYREAHTEVINAIGPPHKLDVTLPSARLGEFVGRVRPVVAAATPGPGVRTWLFGHAADGNLHVNVTGVEPGDERVDDAVLTLVAELGGSISAEHGIGTAKKRWLHLNRSPAELAAMRALKRALDPAGILNPNVLFD